MESHINEIRDTRERIEIKHLKFSDIAQREFNKIMPNDLTQTYSRSVPRTAGKKTKAKRKGDDLLDDTSDLIDDDDQLTSMEQIRQDLDDADNVFGVVYRNKPLKKRKRANSFDNGDSRFQSKDEGELSGDGEDEEPEEGPSVEWLPSSGSERDKCEMGD